MKQFNINVNLDLYEKAFIKFRGAFTHSTDTDNNFVNSILFLFLNTNSSKKQLESFNIQEIALTNHKKLKSTKKIKIRLHNIVISEINKHNKNQAIPISESAIVNKIVQLSIVDFLNKDIVEYTHNLKPIYSFTGYKNAKMRKETAKAIENMPINHNILDLIDVCCGSGGLSFSCNTNFNSNILNDLTPHKVNLLNVLKTNPDKLIKELFKEFEKTNYLKSESIKKDYDKRINSYDKKYKNRSKCTINIDVAIAVLIGQYLDKPDPDIDKISNLIFQILPIHLKLKDATITKLDCRTYLSNDNTNKLVILDTPYIGSEYYTGIDDFDYKKFHKDVSQRLFEAEYHWLYFCRITPPSKIKKYLRDVDRFDPIADGIDVMSKLLMPHFFNKGYYFNLVYLKFPNNRYEIEVMISNVKYSNTQFEWIKYEDLINVVNKFTSDNKLVVVNTI